MVAGALAKSWAARVVVGGRLGGAGFAVATVNIDPAELKTLVGALCGNVALLLREQGLDAQLQFHCGAVRCEGALPEHTALLAAADHAVQSAREKGSNVYQIEDFDTASAAGSRKWQALIEKVLAEDRLALYAQDVLGLPGGQPVHSEVTVRMRVDDGAMPAAQFLPMAARHGLIAKLDCRVLEKVLAALTGGVAAPAVAVNLSARTIADAEASRRLLALIEGAPVLARRIVFEITEFGALQDWRGCLAFADELRRRGARFALDNFSMLQESLMLVHALRPAYIKLSPVYSRDLAKNADCRFLVQSLVRVAQTLDIAVYAQAVEDPALVPELAKLGLSGYQGYAAARPAPFG
jgi:EAL domain-containing protein (putative c-di-GMP-specific phosphodiesterase class I)